MAEQARLTLYADNLSQPCRAVLIFLKVNNIQHTVTKPKPQRNISGNTGTGTSAPENTRINLLQLVPEINDDGFTLLESYAILKYLSEKYPAATHWYPELLQERALVDEFCVWATSTIHISSSYIYIYQILDPKIKNIPVDRERLRRHKTDLDRCLDRLDTHYLHDRLTEGFVCGQQLTFADLLAVCELTQPLAAGHDVFGGRPRLEGWFERVKGGLQPHFDEVHSALQQTRDLRLRLIYQCSSFDVDY